MACHVYTGLCRPAVRRQNHCTPKAIDLIAQKKVDLDFMITHTFRFDQTAEAFDLVADYRDGVVKALIKMDAATEKQQQ